MPRVTRNLAEPRPESEVRAYREAFAILVAFGISAIPAAGVLLLMGEDFIEGDFGLSGTPAASSAGGMAFVCILAGVAARRAWAAGKPLRNVLAAMCWPPVLALVVLCLSMLAFTTEFAFLLDES
jgi:hypothetical protein